MTWSSSRLFLLGSILLCTFAVVSLLWYRHADSDPQGDANVNCTKTDLDPMASATGVVVSGHNTVCDGFGGDSAVYIYVHRTDESEGSDRLVLRYSERTDWDLPKIEWIGANELRIRVKHAIQVTKRLTKIGPVKISYEIDQEDYPSVNVPKEKSQS